MLSAIPGGTTFLRSVMVYLDGECVNQFPVSGTQVLGGRAAHPERPRRRAGTAEPKRTYVSLARWLWSTHRACDRHVAAGTPDPPRSNRNELP